MNLNFLKKIPFPSSFFSHLFGGTVLKEHKTKFMVGFIIFSIGLVFNFPFDRISNALLSKIEKQTQVSVQMEKMSLAFPLGLWAKNLSLSNLPLPPPYQTLELDQMKATISPWSLVTFLLSKSGAVSFFAQKKPAEFSGKTSLGTKEVGLNLKIKQLQGSHTIAWPDPNDPTLTYPVTISGILALTLSVNGNPQSLEKLDLSELSGKVDLKATQAELQVPLLSKLNFEQVSAKGEAQKGKVTLQSLSFNGPQLSAKGSGTLVLKPDLRQSEVKMDAQLTLGEQGQMFRTLLTMAGITLDTNNAAALKISGTFDQLNIKGY